MKFLNIALFAGAAVAQVSVISDAISTISDRTMALDSAVNSFSGPSDIDSLQSAATAVINAINTGNTNVQGISPIDSTAALSLVDPITALAGTVNTAVNDLISKKSALSAESGVVHMNVQQILDATNTFSATTISKIPDALAPTAQNLVQPIIADLNRALNAFPNTPSSTTTGGGSGPTTSSTATSMMMSTSVATSSGVVVTSSAPVYPTGVATVSTVVVPSGTVSVVVPSASSTLAPYNPNGASQLTGGFAAVVVAAAVAVAAF